MQVHGWFLSGLQRPTSLRSYIHDFENVVNELGTLVLRTNVLETSRGSHTISVTGFQSEDVETSQFACLFHVLILVFYFLRLAADAVPTAQESITELCSRGSEARETSCNSRSKKRRET